MLTREQAEFLLDLLQTPGIAFPFAKCKIVVDTCAALILIAAPRDEDTAREQEK